MKQSTYEKISRAAAWTRRIEPKWYIGWAVFCLALAVFTGSWLTVTIGVLYLFMADLARERNKTERRLTEWRDLAIGWHRSSDRWKALYMTEKGKNGR